MPKCRLSWCLALIIMTLLGACSRTESPPRPSSATASPFDRSPFWAWLQTTNDATKGAPTEACMCSCTDLPRRCRPEDGPWCDPGRFPTYSCVNTPGECWCSPGSIKECIPDQSCGVPPLPFHDSGLAIHVTGSADSNCVGPEYQYSTGWSDPVELKIAANTSASCELSFAIVVVNEGLGHRREFLPQVTLDWRAKGGAPEQCENAGTHIVPTYTSNGLGEIDTSKLTYSSPLVLTDDNRAGGCELVINLVNVPAPPAPSPIPNPNPPPRPNPDPYSGPSLFVRFESIGTGSGCDGTTPVGDRKIWHNGSASFAVNFSDATQRCKLTLRYLD